MIIRTEPDPNSDIPFLRKFSDYQLYEMHMELLRGEWPEMLGEAPKGFADLPIDVPKKRFRKKAQKSKRDYTEPVQNLARALLGNEKMEVLAYLQSSTSQRLYQGLAAFNPGTKIEILEELAEHISKNLDLR